jgi:ferritin-like protein
LSGPRDIRVVLNVLVEMKQDAVGDYAHICNLTSDRAPRTCDLALAIVNEEVEHESWFSEIVGEGPAPITVREEISPNITKIPH